MIRNEATANQDLAARAEELARWARLATPGRPAVRRARRGIFAALISLFA